MARMNAGIRTQHDARSRRNHSREVVGEDRFTRSRIRRRRAAAWRQGTALRRGANFGDHCGRDRLFKEFILFA